MVDKQKLLDEVMRREKKPKIKRLFIILLLTLVLGGIYSFSVYKNYDRVKFSHEVNGIIESVTTLETNQSTYVVKLETDKVIKIINFNDSSHHQGDAVKVLSEELESGLLQYSFVKDKSL